MPHDLRDAICDLVRHYAALTELATARLLGWIGLSPRKYHHWRDRYGQANEHNGLVPRDHWIESEERQAIIGFAREFPLEGYRRLTFMMLDHDIAAVSSSTTYRVLKEAGLLQPWNSKPNRQGTGFVQPLEPHDHWHVDFSYLNVAGTFYYLCSVLDGCSRSILSWDIRPAMKEADAEIVAACPSTSRCARLSCKRPTKLIPGSVRGSSPTTVPSSSPRTSKPSFDTSKPPTF